MDVSRSDWSKAKKRKKKVPKSSAAQLSADIRRDFTYESDNPRNVNYNADNNHNRDLDSDI